MKKLLCEYENANDALKLYKVGNDKLKLVFTYIPTSGGMVFGKSWVTLKLNRSKLEAFKQALKSGNKGIHGRSSVIFSSKIKTKPQRHPNNYRDVTLYLRFLILALSWRPAAISREVCAWIYQLEVE